MIIQILRGSFNRVSRLASNLKSTCQASALGEITDVFHATCSKITSQKTFLFFYLSSQSLWELFFKQAFFSIELQLDNFFSFSSLHLPSAESIGVYQWSCSSRGIISTLSLNRTRGCSALLSCHRHTITLSTYDTHARF